MQQDVAVLSKRLVELESIMKEAGLAHRIPPPVSISTTVNLQAEEGEEEGEDEIARSSGAIEAAPDPLEGLLEGVGSLTIREEDGRTRFLGMSGSSAYYAVGDDGDTSDEGEAAFPEVSEPINIHPFIQLGSGISKAHELERLRGFLPERVEGARMARCYWTYLSFQFEPVEESVFWEDYWISAYTPGNLNGTKLACVFMIICLGTLFDPEMPSTPNAEAARYFSLSWATLSAARFMSDNTIAALQTLQLSANFLLNYHNLQEGGESFFPILGIAIRLIATMGLHRDSKHWGLDGVELERRRHVFYELVTLERLQALISGRPYLMNPNHFDTAFPSHASDYHIWKWKLGIFIGRVIDEAFSVKAPTYENNQVLDQEVRDMFVASPSSLRSGALPDNAFKVRPTSAPVLPPPHDASVPVEELKDAQRRHTLDIIFTQILFYLHKPAFTRALELFPEEPLASPWAASVSVVSLETSVYMLAIAASWVRLHPVVNPRWWHIFFHSFAGAVAQSSIVIRSPRSMLARHAWSTLNQAVDIFVAASTGGAPVSAFVPRLIVLRDMAYTRLQSTLTVSSRLNTAHPDTLPDDVRPEGESNDADLSILGPMTRLERKSRRVSNHAVDISNERPPTLASASGFALSTTTGTAPRSEMVCGPVEADSSQFGLASSYRSWAAAPLPLSQDPNEVYTPFDHLVLPQREWVPPAPFANVVPGQHSDTSAANPTSLPYPGSAFLPSGVARGVSYCHLRIPPPMQQAFDPQMANSFSMGAQTTFDGQSSMNSGFTGGFSSESYPSWESWGPTALPTPTSVEVQAKNRWPWFGQPQ